MSALDRQVMGPHDPHVFHQAQVRLADRFEQVWATRVVCAEDTQAMIQAIRSRYTPDAVVIFRPSDEEEPEITKVAGFTRDIVTIEGKATAYVCTNYACDIPVTDIDEMLRLMRTTSKPPEPVI